MTLRGVGFLLGEWKCSIIVATDANWMNILQVTELYTLDMGELMNCMAWELYLNKTIKSQQHRSSLAPAYSSTGP